MGTIGDETLTPQEILNRIFTGSSFRSTSTSGGGSSSTAGAYHNPPRSEQDCWNGAFDSTNNQLNLA